MAQLPRAARAVLTIQPHSCAWYNPIQFERLIRGRSDTWPEGKRTGNAADSGLRNPVLMHVWFMHVCLALELCFTPGLFGLFVQEPRNRCPESESPGGTFRDVLRLPYREGYSLRATARWLRISVTTVSDYVRHAATAELTWPLPAELTDEELQRKLFPKLRDLARRPAPDWEWV